MRRLPSRLAQLILAALAAAWLLSLLSSFSLESPRFSLGIHDRSGYLIAYAPEIVRGRESVKPHAVSLWWRLSAGPFPWRPWLPLWRDSATKSSYFILPLWLPIAVFAIPALGPPLVRRALALYRARYRKHECRRCGYDLSGLPGAAAVCPECGHAGGAG
ncbi:MAG: hypothetical protein WD749_11800 [Phycisphaerales bacterium]